MLDCLLFLMSISSLTRKPFIQHIWDEGAVSAGGGEINTLDGEANDLKRQNIPS